MRHLRRGAAPGLATRVRLPAGRMLLAAFAFLAGAAQTASAQQFEVGAVAVEQPWVRAVPPGATVAGGYATITNAGPEADRLVGIATPIAGRVEIHEMGMGADGMMTMRPLADGLEIPAGGAVTLAPGGLHIMFMQLTMPPAAGHPFRGTLTFAKAGAVEVEFAVAPIGALTPPSHDSHAAGHHGSAGTH